MKILRLIYFLTFLVCISMHVNHEQSSVFSKVGKNTFSKRHSLTIFDKYTYFQFSKHLINKTELLRKIDLARETAFRENELRLEEEKREKVFRQYLASRVQSSFIRDFLTRRY